MTGSLVAPVLAASLVGSLHCAGMCGGFVAFYVGSDQNAGRDRALAHLAYNGGRLVTYAALGALAGWLGAALNLAGQAAGVGRIAGVIAGGVMISWGLALLLAAAGVNMPRLRVAQAAHARVVRALGALRGKPPIVRAALIGLSSTLLPCGWLYGFAVSAASTGNALDGATVMLAFWLGTVPVLLGLGLGVQTLARRLRRYVPTLSAAALIVVGLTAVLGRLDAPRTFGRAVQQALGAVPGTSARLAPPSHRGAAP